MMHLVVSVGVRVVMRGTATAGRLVVIDMPGSGAVLGQSGFLDLVATSWARPDATISKATILGEPVRFISRPGLSLAVYLHGDDVIEFAGPNEHHPAIRSQP